MKNFYRFIKEHIPYLIMLHFGLFIAMILLAFVYFSNNPVTQYSGFAVDQYERVYIGTASGYIRVYKGQNEIGKFRFTSRGFAFTIKNGTELIYDTGVESIYVDLNQDFLNHKEDSVIKREPYKKRSHGYIEDANLAFYGNGQVYTAKRTICTCDIYSEAGECILSIGNKSMFAVFVLLIIFFIAFMINVITLVWCYGKRCDKKHKGTVPLC